MKTPAVRAHLTFGGWRNWVFVQVETDEGLTGLGEATLERRGRTIAAAVADFSRHLAGRDPRHIEEHACATYRNALRRGGPVLNSAIGDVE